MLKIEKKNEKEAIVFQMEGRLDTVTAPELEEELQKVLPEAKELVLDLEKLDYISSAGLRVFLSAQKIMMKQGSMKVTHVNEMIKEIFEVTGFADLLDIEE